MGRDGRRQDALRRGHPPFVRAVSGRKLHVLHHRHGPRRPPIPIRAEPTTIRRARPTASPSHGTAPLSAEKQREKIITQKWIALYPLGTEAWAEQRRTGYPRFYPTPTSTNASNEPNLPTEGASRIPFAPNEQTRNADNYDAAVALLGAGGDKFGTRLWWDVKTDKPAW